MKYIYKSDNQKTAQRGRHLVLEERFNKV